MKIGITYNLKDQPNADFRIAGAPEERFEEFDSPETIDGIIKALEKLGHQCFRLGFGRIAIRRLLENNIDFVFNIAEGYSGRSREALMPSLLEIFGIPYSGPDPLTASITLDKAMAKRVASFAGVATPSYTLFEPGKEANLKTVTFPAILKPAWEGSSKGIRRSSLVNNIKELDGRLKDLRADYAEETIIAENFISGREITVGIVGNGDPGFIGMMEIIPRTGKSEEFIYSIEVKRDYLKRVKYQAPPDIDVALKNRIEQAALNLFKMFGCRDASRFDFRIDRNGDPYFLEVNALPGLNPVSSDLVIMAKLLGVEYGELIAEIFKSALSRYKKAGKHEHV